jgi:hypothetical protein
LGRLERTRIDPEQDLALPYFLAFAELHLEDLAVDTGFHSDRRIGLDVPMACSRTGILCCSATPSHQRRGRALGGRLLPRARVAAEVSHQSAADQN